MNPFQRIGAWLAHPDPRVAACNAIALVVAWNQPFYPFYIHWLVGGPAWVACLTFLSTPFFVAVPAVARRHPLAGRVLLPLAGIGNCVLGSWALGPNAGIVLFLIPCVAITLLAFRPAERAATALLLLLAVAAFVGLRFAPLPPLGQFDPTKQAALFRLNGWSVATLSIFVLWSFRATLFRRR